MELPSPSSQSISSNNQTQQTCSEVTRSEVYCDDAYGPLIFRAGERLFRFPTIWHLAKKSEFFEGLCGLTRCNNAVSGNSEGLSDDNPIIVNDREDDFEAFAQWIIMFKRPLSLSEWIGVLAISTKYCIKDGIQQALYHLRAPKGGDQFCPIFKLRLAWQFLAEDWYDECIRDVLKPPYKDLTAEDLSDLECDLASVILRIRSRCSRHRLELVPYTAEVFHHVTCPDQGICAKNWRRAFSAGMLFYTHTVKFYTGRDIFTMIKKVEIPGLQSECRRLTMEELETKGVLWREEVFAQRGVEEVKKLLLNSRPTCPRPKPRFITNSVVSESG